MSIWSSVPPIATALGPVPERDNYTGEPSGRMVYSFDVATAKAWSDTIRFVADECDTSDLVGVDGVTPFPRCVNYVECLLTPDEAREVVRRLEAALAHLGYDV
jgi:hypothetical protein